MRRYQLAGAAIAGILFIAANGAAAFAVLQRQVLGGNSTGSHLIEDAAPTKENKKFLAIQLICPRTNTGRLETVSVNRLGTGEKFRIEYLQGAATSIQISYNENANGIFDEALNVDLTSNEPSSTSLDLLIGRKLVEVGNAKLRGICNGSAEARKKYRATLKANQRILGLSPEDYPSNF